MKNPTHTANQERYLKLKDGASITFKSCTLLAYLLGGLWLLLEIKQHHAIDVLPGIDSPIDDFYGFIRSSILQLF